MDDLRGLPLLGQLSPVELAKLLPDLQELRLEINERLPRDQLAHKILFVQDGHLELQSEVDGRVVWVSRLRTGAFLGEEILLGRADGALAVVALEPTRLAAVPAQTFAKLLRDRPGLLDRFNHALLERSADRLDELVRVRRMMAAYSEELWSSADADETLPLPRAPDLVAAATLTGELSRRKRKSTETSSGQGRFRPSRKVLITLVATAAAGVLAYAPLGLPVEVGTRQVLAFLLWGALCWLFDSMPDYIVALCACLGIAATGLVSPALALSGFASPTWFLLLGVWAIGAAVGRTGLLYRIALYILKWLPNNYAGQSLALAITGVLVTPLLPSPQGRIVMAAPLTLELSEAMRFPPRSTGSVGLAMASFLGFGEMYFLFLNGTTTGILAWTLLPAAIRSNASWMQWLIACLPLGVIVFILSFWAIARLFPVPATAGVSPELIRAQLRVLGPMRTDERIGLAVILLMLLGFVTSPLHGIDPAWFAVAGMLTLLAANVLDRETFGQEVNWSFLLFFGAVIGIANVAREMHLDVLLAHLVTPLFSPVLAHPALAILAVGVLTLLVRLVLSSIQAIPLLTITLIPVFVKAGYNPFGAVLAVVAASTTFAAPMLSPAYASMLAGTREQMFTNRQIRVLAWVHSAILLLGLLASAPYWAYLKAL